MEAIASFRTRKTRWSDLTSCIVCQVGSSDSESVSATTDYRVSSINVSFKRRPQGKFKDWFPYDHERSLDRWKTFQPIEAFIWKRSTFIERSEKIQTFFWPGFHKIAAVTQSQRSMCVVFSNRWRSFRNHPQRGELFVSVPLLFLLISTTDPADVTIVKCRALCSRSSSILYPTCTSNSAILMSISAESWQSWLES